jgi:hypothetical protein
MDTLEINAVMMGDDYTRGVFGGTWSIDTIPTPTTYPTCYIINSSPSWHPGSHWTAVYLDKSVREHFCSYGMAPPDNAILDLLGRRYAQNSRQLQTATGDLCGQYCILYLMCRCRGYTMKKFVGCFTTKTNVNDFIVRKLLPRLA